MKKSTKLSRGEPKFEAEADATWAAGKTELRLNPISVVLTILIILILITAGYMKKQRDRMFAMKEKIIPGAVTRIVGDSSMKLKEITNLREVNGIYEFEISFDVNGTIRKYTSYITKNGKIFFTAGTKIDTLAGEQKQDEKKPMTCNDVAKSDTPTLAAYIVSDCPFGLQMQRVINKTITERPELAKSYMVRYIGSIQNGKIISMHGDKEAQENLRQICIREEQNPLYWPYVTCYMKEGKSTDCLSTARLNTWQLNSCTADPKRGLAFAQKDFDMANTYQISGSPTLLVNDSQVVSEFDFGGRAPNALKDILCCASKTKQGYCDKELSKDQVATSFSLTDAPSVNSNTAANCSN